MDAQQFLTEFGHIASAPNGVQRLREMVLQLAVQGRLVEQSAEEGDGHSLLAQIRDLNSGAGRVGDPQLEELARIQVPANWTIGCLGEVTDIVRGVTFPGSAKSKVKSSDTVACLRTASIQNEIDWDDLIYISPSHVGREDQWVRPSDIAISMANSYELVGKVALVKHVPQRATFGGFIAVIRAKLIQPDFLLVALRSPGMQAAFRESSSQTTNIANISLGRMRPLPFPIPPLAEQKRIVAKVDELMALCDRLEALQNQRKAARAVLTKEILGRVASDATVDAQTCLQNLSLLVSDVDQIPVMRQTILSLAVQGKLVPQDSGDEPVVQQLRRIGVAKERLLQSGAISEERATRSRSEGKSAFAIPSTWKWVRLFDLCELVTKGSSPKWQGVNYTTNGVLFITSENVGNFRLRKIDELKYVDSKFNEIERRSVLRCGDILMNLVGASIGRTALYDLEDGANINQAVALIRLVRGSDEDVSKDYLLQFLNGPSAIDTMLSSRVISAQPNISLTDVREFRIPLPPLAEQKRIVAKVDELMALCDRLEAKLRKASQVQEQLAASSVAALTGKAA